jgi:hypothetical protein
VTFHKPVSWGVRITGLDKVFRTQDTVRQPTAVAGEPPAGDSGRQPVAPAPSSDLEDRKGLLRLVSD